MTAPDTPIPRLVITAGEPAGIGPDIVLKAAQRPCAAERVCIASHTALADRARQLGLDIELIPYTSNLTPEPSAPGQLLFIDIPTRESVVPGQLNPANAGYVLATLNLAVELCRHGEAQAMVTAPVQKSVINDAGIPFTGHTEFLAELTDTPEVVMMLATEKLRVALATTHLPLSAVPQAITREGLEATLSILHADLRSKFGVSNPRITVLGLNPHAGEGGHLGREEIDIIQPTLNILRDAGMHIAGPVPADTAFNPDLMNNTDAYLAMYHDQGLPVLKYSGFGEAVNITLGLPIIRTSVDHGTALDLAGSGKAEESSLIAAMNLALLCAHNCVSNKSL